MLHCQIHQNHVLTLFFQSTQAYVDPFNMLEMDVVVSGPGDQTMVIPAFWAGGAQWKARFSSPETGSWSFVTRCTNPEDSGLHGIRGEIEVLQGMNEINPLYIHGPVRVREDGRSFEYHDGEPFYWLGDTWWMALGGRMLWPEEFQRLAADRTAKGFTVVHLVAGLYPDMAVDDARNSNPGGPAWEAEFSRINPAFYDHADHRIEYLVEQGVVPLIVGCWGYYLPVLGQEAMRRHWRYLIARWGAYPVLWCVAGEAAMPYYQTTTREIDVAFQRGGWSEISHYVKALDPWKRPLTVHSSAFAGSDMEIDDPSALDFSFAQGAHGNILTAWESTKFMANKAAEQGSLPLVNGETCYEGILGTAWQDVQRYLFWSNMLSGVKGYSYGANGIWQVNRRGDPYGPSPHGMTWGNLPWDEAMHLAGSYQLGLGMRLLRELGFEQFEAHPEWIDPHSGGEDWRSPFCAGIPGVVRVVYAPQMISPVSGQRPKIQHLSEGYSGFYFDPATGERTMTGEAIPDADGQYELPLSPLGADMVFVLRRIS